MNDADAVELKVGDQVVVWSGCQYRGVVTRFTPKRIWVKLLLYKNNEGWETNGGGRYRSHEVIKIGEPITNVIKPAIAAIPE